MRQALSVFFILAIASSAAALDPGEFYRRLEWRDPAVRELPAGGIARLGIPLFGVPADHLGPRAAHEEPPFLRAWEADVLGGPEPELVVYQRLVELVEPKPAQHLVRIYQRVPEGWRLCRVSSPGLIEFVYDYCEPAPADLDGDGKRELTLLGECAGSAGGDELAAWRFAGREPAVARTGEYHYLRTSDLDGDGVPEFAVEEDLDLSVEAPSNGARIFAPRILAFRDGRFVDVSARFPAFYRAARREALLKLAKLGTAAPATGFEILERDYALAGWRAIAAHCRKIIEGAAGRKR